MISLAEIFPWPTDAIEPFGFALGKNLVPQPSHARFVQCLPQSSHALEQRSQPMIQCFHGRSLLTFHQIPDGKKALGQPRSVSQRLLDGQRQHSRVVFQFLPAMWAGVRVEIISKLHPAMGAF
jgi:hypothetical protein